MATAPVSAAKAAQTLNAGVGALANNYETFLHLLTTQLKNQDPLSPMETTEFTSQLTAMTGVQQQLLTNQLLTQMISQDQIGMSGEAVNLIGKEVIAEDPTITLAQGKADFTYELPKGVAKTKLEVVDSRGKAVWTGEANDNAQGLKTLQWNGTTTDGRQMPDGGEYVLRVTAMDEKGTALPTKRRVAGVVSRVQNIDGQTVLTIGNAKALLSSMTSVALASTTQNPQ